MEETKRVVKANRIKPSITQNKPDNELTDTREVNVAGMTKWVSCRFIGFGPVGECGFPGL